MSFLELRRVSKSYGAGPTEVHAVQDVDLAVERGSLIAVMGPSGSGKSTLLTIAGSLEEPTSGEVLIDGASIQAMSRNDRARLRRRTVGYVFQDFNLLAGLTAVENVSLPLELRRALGEKGPCCGDGRARGARPRRSSDALPRRASPAVNASASPLRGRSSGNGTCSWRTSRPGRSTRRMGRR